MYNKVYAEQNKEYYKIYWKDNKDKYGNRIISQLGNPRDDERFLKYKHTIDKAKPQQRKKIIKSYQPLADESFRYGNQAETLK